MLSGTLSVKQGIIVSVNRSKWTCTVKLDSGTAFETVAIAPIYLNKYGNGIYYFPEVDSMVLVAEVGDKQFILGTSYPIDEEKPFESVDDIVNESDLEPAHNGFRPIADPGDYVMNTKGGGFINMKSSGLIEIGASQISRRFYIPINNFIRDLCQSYQLNTAGGNLEFINRVGDETHGFVKEFVKTNPSDPNDVAQEKTFTKSPVEFNLNIKEFAEDENDTIQISMGRLKENDGDNSKLLGSIAKDFNTSVVFRCNIADKFTYFIDKHGTVVHTVSGSASYSYQSSLRVFVQGSKTEKVNGENRTFCLDEVKKVKNNSSVEVLANKTERIGGALTINVAKNKKEEVLGQNHQKINASSLIEVSGSSKTDVNGDCVVIVSGNLTQTVAEKTVFSHADDVKLSMLKGDYNIESVLGGIDLKTKVGKSSLSCLQVSEVAATIGSAYIKYQGGSEVNVNPTGAAMSSAGGKISLDQAGSTRIGAKKGSPGYVITTATNPVCFVTGLPLLGAANVVVNSTASTPFTVPAVPSTYVDK